MRHFSKKIMSIKNAVILYIKSLYISNMEDKEKYKIIKAYLDKKLEQHELRQHPYQAKISSWDEIMSLIDLIQEMSRNLGDVIEWPIRFEFHDNVFWIKYTYKGEEHTINDKGNNAQEAAFKCCFEFFKRFDETAPQIDALTDDSFLLDED